MKRNLIVALILFALWSCTPTPTVTPTPTASSPAAPVATPTR